MSKVILGGESGRTTQQQQPRASTPAGAQVLIAPLTAIGLTLCGIAALDLGLLWFPLRLGRNDWEFGTASQAFNALPLWTTAYLFLVLAALLKNSSRLLRVLSIVSLLTVLIVGGWIVLVALNVPIIIRNIPEGGRTPTMLGLFRTVGFAGLFITFYVWLTWFTWRRAGAARRGGTQ